jgi:hypothetical protein
MSDHRFRVFAEECLDAARKTADPNVRTQFLMMAQKWIKWAGRTPPTTVELCATPASPPA